MILWSDTLIFLLVAALFLLVRQIRKNPETRKKWRQVFQSRIGMASFIIIMVYVFVALLDSLHYREALPATEVQLEKKSSEVHYSNEIKSVLDWVLSDMKENSEKTYSAPFSLYSFAKENMNDEQGRLYRDFSRLIKGGAHIDDPGGKLTDISLRS